jgi:hypothetical protein
MSRWWCVSRSRHANQASSIQRGLLITAGFDISF